MDCKARSILDFTKHVTANDSLIRVEGEISINVKLFMKNLPLARKDIPADVMHEFKRTGVDLYNKSTKIVTDDAEYEASKKTVTSIRAMALFMVISCSKLQSKHPHSISSLTNAVLSTTKECLRVADLDTAGKFIEYVATTEPLFNLDQKQHDLTDASHRCLTTYYSLRLTLACKRERLDLAEHWFNHLENLVKSTQHHCSSEMLIDLLLEVGVQELQGSDNKGAILWLQRAYTLLQHEPIKTEFLTTDLRLNVLHAYCRALFQSNDLERAESAEQLLENLRQEYGNRLPIILLRLEMLSTNLLTISESFAQVLTEVVHMIPLVDQYHNLVLHYIHHLHKSEPSSAQEILREYIAGRLLPGSLTKWTEEAMVKYIWFFTSRGDATGLANPSELQSTLDGFSQSSSAILSMDAAQAVHAILWKAVHHAASEDSHATVGSWCQIALHKLFERSGDANIGKFERKLLAWYLSVSELESARSILDQMSFLRRNHPLSQVLAYSLAIRTHHATEAQVALNTIANAPEDNSVLLMACVAEAKRRGSAFEVARLLQRLFDRHLERPIVGIENATLLKAATQALIQLTEQDDFDNNEEVFIRLCAAFKAARSLPSTTCMPWFAGMAYQISICRCTTWEPKFTLDILHHGERLSSILISAVGPVNPENQLQHWRILRLQILLYACESHRAISGLLNIDDLPKTSYESKERPDTPNIRQILNEHVYQKFAILQLECAESSQFLQDDDFRPQMYDLVPLAFDALLYLTTESFIESEDLTFDEANLQNFVLSARQLQVPVGTYALLADQILVASSSQCHEDGRVAVRMPLLAATRLVGQLVAVLHDISVYDINQAARWIRCIVQLIINSIEKQLEDGAENSKLERSGLSMLSSVVGQATKLVKDTMNEHRNLQSLEDMAVVDADSTSSAVVCYPAEELEWLVVKVFNVSIDLFIAQNTELASCWGQKAVDLALVLDLVHVGHGHDLLGLLRKRLQELGLYVEPP